jgi:hypothetical protein
MGSMSQAHWGTPAVAVTAAFVGWSIFLPIGVKYPLLLGATAWGLWQLRRQGGFSHVKAEPAMRLAVLFWAWSAVSALWTAGPWQEAAGQVGLYALVLCVPVIAREARAQGKRWRAHLAHLVVHGALHAQGHDHETDAEAARMERLETRLLAGLGYPDPYRPAPSHQRH